jgi:hypothetical protein
MNKKQAKKLHEEAQQCIQVADRTADDKVAAALLAYASALEQRARLIESARNPNGPSRPDSRFSSRPR